MIKDIERKDMTVEEHNASVKKGLIAIRPNLDEQFERFGFKRAEYTEGENLAPHMVGWIHVGKEWMIEITINQKTGTLVMEQNKKVGDKWEISAVGLLSPLTELILNATEIYFISKKTQPLNEYLDAEALSDSIIDGTNGDK